MIKKALSPLYIYHEQGGAALTLSSSMLNKAAQVSRGHATSWQLYLRLPLTKDSTKRTVYDIRIRIPETIPDSTCVSNLSALY